MAYIAVTFISWNGKCTRVWEVHTCMESGFITSVNEGGQLLMSSKKRPKEKSLGNDFVVIGNTMMKCPLPKVG